MAFRIRSHAFWQDQRLSASEWVCGIAMGSIQREKLSPVGRGVHKMTYDFIVLGAGIAGASVAYELARSSRVCLIEAEERPGIHATGRSAALFAPTYGGRAIRALTRASRAFFDRPPPGFSEHALLKPRGCLYPASSGQCDRLALMVEEIRSSGGRVAMLSKKEAIARVPLLRPDYLAAAALDTDAMDIDVDALEQGFLRGGRAAGAILVAQNRVAKAQRRNGVWSIELTGGSVSAPILINAAGAWADEVAVIFGARPIGLQPLRRTAVLVDPPAGVDIRNWPAVIDTDEQFYFKPDAGKLLLSPADETPDKAGDAHPEELDIAICVDRVQAALDIEVRRISHSWAGLRTFAADRIPVVGFDPEIAGFFWCAGQGGYGIQTSPALARTAAALARQETLPDDVVAEGLKADDLSAVRFLEVGVANRLQIG
jgi:D-arginine dehydrogenase